MFGDIPSVMSPLNVVQTPNTLLTDRTPLADCDHDILPFIVLLDDDRLAVVDVTALLSLVSLLQMDAAIGQHLVRNRPGFLFFVIFRHCFSLLGDMFPVFPT